MRCRRRLVFLWVDGDRGSLPVDRMRRHLEECPACRERADAVESMIALVRSRCRRERPPETLVERIRFRIERS